MFSEKTVAAPWLRRPFFALTKPSAANKIYLKRGGKLKVAGIICEYNPLHNGHIYQLEQTRKTATHIVCVMSGNFVQRGDLAIADKWSRAKAAILSGADLVVELPTAWACSSAENFARGGIYILSCLGVDMLSFGC